MNMKKYYKVKNKMISKKTKLIIGKKIERK